MIFHWNMKTRKKETSPESKTDENFSRPDLEQHKT